MTGMKGKGKSWPLIFVIALLSVMHLRLDGAWQVAMCRLGKGIASNYQEGILGQKQKPYYQDRF